MTKQETNRSLLRAFTLTARAIAFDAALAADGHRTFSRESVAIGANEATWRLAHDRTRSRRKRIHSRNVARAFATAWGL